MNRDSSIDSLKGFLIIFVILGHIIGNLGVRGPLWNLIYTFHMPLFVLISGYLSKPDKLSLGSILKPLLVFQIINVSLLILQGSSFSISYLIVPYWTLWYLLSLISWRIILYIIPKSLLNKPYLLLAITFICSLIIGVVLPNGRVLSIQRTITFLPFFLMGYYFKNNLIMTKLWPDSFSIFLILAVSLFITILWYPQNANILLRGADPYSAHDLLSKMFILCCTMIMIYSFWNLKKYIFVFNEIGRNSLFYYLYHGLIIKFVLEPIVYKLSLPTNLISYLFYLVVIIAFLYLISKLKFFRWFVAPSFDFNRALL